MQTVRSSGDMLLSLINGVLDFSKIEAGKLEIESVPFDLEIELEAVVRAFEERARERGLQLALQIEPDLERLVVGDPVRVRQIVMNLVSNALKFTTRGRIAVEVGRDPTAAHEVRFSVRDTGIGMSAEQQARLFEAFVQADSSTTRKYGGTGLGLAICRRLVDLMGGRIGVESEPGVGSSFRFALPLRNVTQSERTGLAAALGIRGRSLLVVSDDARQIEQLGELLSAYEAIVRWAPSASAVAATLSSGPPPDLVVLATESHEGAPALGTLLRAARVPLLVLGDAPVGELGPSTRRLAFHARRSTVLTSTAELLDGKRAAAAEEAAERRVAPRVLVAEDNVVNQRVVEAMLKRLGCEVVIAGDGVQAVDKCNGNSFDLVLMDYQMPGIDGPEAARRIRDAERERGKERVAIVALTANVGDEFKAHCTAAGMDDFVTKPMQRSDLQRVIDRFVG
jgi:CheY-like chemotaxis protein